MTVMAHVLRPQRLPVKAPSSLHICRGRRSTLTTVKTWTFCWWHQRSHPVWGRHQLRYVIAIRKARRGDTLVMLNHQRRHIEWQSHARARFQSPFRVSFGKKSSAKHRRLRETRPELRTQRISKRVYQKEKTIAHRDRQERRRIHPNKRSRDTIDPLMYFLLGKEEETPFARKG